MQIVPVTDDNKGICCGTLLSVAVNVFVIQCSFVFQCSNVYDQLKQNSDTQMHMNKSEKFVEI